MVSEMKVEVTHKETIKPSSPTPSHLQTTNLSVFDQLSPDVYIPLLLFYPNNSRDDEANNIDHHSSVAERSKILKTSLSETLTHFYPFAGEFQYNVSISCNDHGAAFFEARVNCPISTILDEPDFVILKKLLPTGIGSTQADTGYLLLVQANFFDCGGLAIGVSSSHIITDAYTLSTFIKSWADIALMASTTTDHHALLPKKFGAAATLFPQLDFLNSPQPALEFAEEKCITKRFVFHASKIAALKSRAASATVPNPTRIEAVSALIWKCATETSQLSNSGVVRASEWSSVVNIRKILVQQPLAYDLMGNLVGLFSVRTEASEVVDIDVQSLVAKLRKGVEEFKIKYGNGVSGEEACQFFREFGNLMTRDVDNYNCSSWCRFPFYETNFGWGKPLWVCQSTGMKNLIVLMDTRDGVGIEVSLTFKEETMAVFETNKELLAYASVNPTVI
ncbi:hypothetical protein L3X38_022830 [Prunus dulcis]|uniref:HXXXD-type acyl-transferase family protein n=1 Tax=Prunus dulcis TaxID=3755 RepID=A0AAD4VZA0_PRUDU|nr:hypothetical protein L3X38_022830 [Prunus dulcis]